MRPSVSLPSVAGVDGELGHNTSRDNARFVSFSWSFWRR